MRWLPRRYRKVCPCCDQKVPETIEHILWDCKAWAKPRQSMFSRCGQLWKGFAGTSNKLERVVGDYPDTLDSVGLAKSFSEAKTDWEREHIMSRGWVRARKPIWRFLGAIWQARKRILDPIIDTYKLAMRKAPLHSPRVEAPSGRTGVHCHRGNSEHAQP